MSTEMHTDVMIIGGGVAGRSAGIFTARHGFETTILTAGSPLLRRNANLENYPGFPAGISARLLLDMMRDHAERSGCSFVDGQVIDVTPNHDGFAIETEGGQRWSSEYVIAATKNDVSYLEDIDGVRIVDRGKLFVDTDESGRTGVSRLYVAGRMAEKPHQAIVCAGHGAEVAVALLEDDDRPFYHDWVAPDRYFTGRGRDVPPGCEEIDDDERIRREQAGLEVLQDYVRELHPDPPEQHPSVDED